MFIFYYGKFQAYTKVDSIITSIITTFFYYLKIKNLACHTVCWMVAAGMTLQIRDKGLVSQDTVSRKRFIFIPVLLGPKGYRGNVVWLRWMMHRQ